MTRLPAHRRLADTRRRRPCQALLALCLACGASPAPHRGKNTPKPQCSTSFLSRTDFLHPPPRLFRPVAVPVPRSMYRPLAFFSLPPRPFARLTTFTPHPAPPQRPPPPAPSRRRRQPRVQRPFAHRLAWPAARLSQPAAPPCRLSLGRPHRVPSVSPTGPCFALSRLVPYQPALFPPPAARPFVSTEIAPPTF